MNLETTAGMYLWSISRVGIPSTTSRMLVVFFFNYLFYEKYFKDVSRDEFDEFRVNTYYPPADGRKKGFNPFTT